jgi:hypothetical protein
MTRKNNSLIDASRGTSVALSKNPTTLLLQYRLHGQTVVHLCLLAPIARIPDHKCAEKNPKNDNFNSIWNLLHTTS